LPEKVCDAVDERSRLAGAGSGDDEQRAGGVRGGCALFCVQFREEIARRLGYASFSRGLESRTGGILQQQQ
jgi:hypothetical protein